MNTLEMVRLKNGQEEAAISVAATMITLEDLWTNEPICAYELVQMARTHGHVPFGNTEQKLRERGLMNPAGVVHGIVKNVVLSAVTGEGFDLVLGSPVGVKP